MKVVTNIEEIKSYAAENKWLFLGSQETDRDETVYHWLTTTGNQVSLTYHQQTGEAIHIRIDNT